MGNEKRTAELKESEEMFRTITESSADAIFIADQTGNYTYVNKASCALLGYAADELIGMNISDIVDEDARDSAVGSFESLFMEGRLVRKIELVRKDGSRAPVDLNAVVLPNGSAYGSCRDITERKQAEEALQVSEEKYSSIFRNSPIPIVLFDVETRSLISTNDAYTKLSGYGADEVVDRPGKAGFMITSTSAFQRAWATVESSKPFRGIELTLRTKNGEEREVILQGEPLNIRGRRMFMVNIVDITEPKLAEEALRTSEEKFSKVFHSSPDSITLTFMETGRLVEINKSFEQIFGYTRDEALGKSTLELGLWRDREDRSRMIAELENMGSFRDLDIELKNKSGEFLSCLISCEVIEIQGERFLLSVTRNITERRQMENALRESEERLRAQLKGSPVPTYIWRKEQDDFVLTDFNDAADEFTNGYISQLVGSQLGAMYKDNPAIREDVSRCHDERSGIAREMLYHLQSTGLERMLAVKYAFVPPDQVLVHTEDITERNLARAQLEERLQFESLLREMSTSLLSTPASGADEEMERWLERVRAYAGADRTGVWYLYDPDSPHFRLVREAVTASTSPTINQDSQGYPWIASRIQTGEAVCFSSLAELPAESRDRQTGAEEGVEASMVVPMIVDERFVGAFSFDSVNERDWSPDLVDRMHLVAGVFANALERKRASEELEAALVEVRELKERAEAENVFLRKEVKQASLHGEIVGQSDGMRSVLALAERVAETDSSVLILGETGTGKELVARAIHNMSPRKDRSLVVVNCAAVPSTLVEGELFGREKGAFTGAMTKQLGRFEIADGSTIFLDEVGELPTDAQAKLLRVLQEGELQRLGSSSTIRVDVRVIAATNRDLEQEVTEGRFRQDLYYRLNVFPIEIPPLRERREDIAPLVWSFVAELNEKMGRRIERIGQKTIDAMTRHEWRGNVRELRNAVERAMILATGSTLSVNLPQVGSTRSHPPRMSLEDVNREHIREVLESVGWRIRGTGGAAEVLGLKPSTLESRMGKLGICRPHERTR